MYRSAMFSVQNFEFVSQVCAIGIPIHQNFRISRFYRISSKIGQKSGNSENQTHSNHGCAKLGEGVAEFCKKIINNHYEHVPPASVPPRDDHSDLRINQVAGRGRVSDFGENQTKIGKIGHRGGENRDLS